MIQEILATHKIDFPIKEWDCLLDRNKVKPKLVVIAVKPDDTIRLFRTSFNKPIDDFKPLVENEIKLFYDESKMELIAFRNINE